MNYKWAIKDGQLTDRGTLALGAIGIVLVLYTLLLSENRWIGTFTMIIGLGCLFFAGMANKAKSLGIHPFGDKFNDWRAAKATYKNDVDMGADKISKKPPEKNSHL